MATGDVTLPRQGVLVSVLATFALLHLVPLITRSFVLIGVSRVLWAFSCWAVGAVIVMRSSPSGAAGRALAVLAGGLTLSYVAGVPIGTWIGQALERRATFVSVAIATALVAPRSQSHRFRQRRGCLAPRTMSSRSGAAAPDRDTDHRRRVRWRLARDREDEDACVQSVPRILFRSVR